MAAHIDIKKMAAARGCGLTWFLGPNLNFTGKHNCREQPVANRNSDTKVSLHFLPIKKMMGQQDIQRAFSVPRFDRFLAAARGDYGKALDLYRANTRLSSNLFAVLSVFEVTLRNAIDHHYTARFGGNWLLSQTAPSGFLSAKGCEKSRENVTETIQKFGQTYTHDRTVASLNFGFWRYLFASKEFAAAGFTLLKVFPRKPSGRAFNHTYAFNALYQINAVRNRIAHHEPICFAPQSDQISAWTALQPYAAVGEMLDWLDFDQKTILQDIDFVVDEIRHLVNLAKI